ncbi:hypothetical protein BS630_18350 [Rhizobium laguerreae]|nr:hypothetical protein BS630_18350 [Rhizobium laguerreae]
MLETIVPGADEVKSSFEDEVKFYDPGENWSGVKCSACGADAPSPPPSTPSGPPPGTPAPRDFTRVLSRSLARHKTAAQFRPMRRIRH